MSLLLLLSIVTEAKYSIFHNVNPANGMIGMKLGGMQPLGGDGQVFGSGGDMPHADFGLIMGLDYWKRNRGAFDYHIGINAKYVQYHFHHIPVAREELTGRYRLLYYSLPVSIHWGIPKYPFLQLILGAAVTSQNTLPVQSGTLEDYSYSSTIDLQWAVSPEIFVGINFMEEKTDFAIFRGSINYSTFPFRNQFYGTFMSNATEQLSANRRMGSGRFELLLTIYPKWKFRKGVGNDEGINCPSPF